MQQAIVVEQAPNPSTEGYVLPALQAAGLSVKRHGFGNLPSAGELTGCVLIFVRYIPAPWMRLVDRVRESLLDLVLFVDDDILDWRAAVGLNWQYRLKLWRLAASKVPWFRRQGGRLWVSTPYLQNKYAAWAPSLLLPNDASIAAEDVVRIFYHGSDSHRADLRWLKAVIPEALSEDPRLRFELIGDWRVQHAWRHLPQVSVVHPMAWDAYRSFSTLQGRQIGLAPLMDTRFNRARSYTKFLDITRSGACGIYQDHPVFRDAVRNGVDGILLSDDPALWRRAILDLAGDEQLRMRMLASARQRVAELNALARSGYGRLDVGPGESD